MSYNTEWSIQLISSGILLIILLICSYQYYQRTIKSNYNLKNIRNKKRIVRFKPSIEGHKFQRKAAKTSEYFENAAKKYLLPNNNDNKLLNNIHIDLIPHVKKEFGFFIRNVLTPQECNQLIKASELTGFEQRKYSGKGDDSSSCCFESNLLTNDIVFKRIQKYLIKQSYFDADSSLTLNELTYYTESNNGNNQTIESYGVLDCLNTSCRIEKYNSQQHLKIHRDGCVLVQNTKNVFTVYAIVLYLNNNYKDGYTRFCVDIDPNTKGLYPYKFLDVKGNTGDALIFRHEILHKGGSVTGGTKYILRLDAAYSLVVDK